MFHAYLACYTLRLPLNFEHSHSQESFGNVVQLLLDMGGLRAGTSSQSLWSKAWKRPPYGGLEGSAVKEPSASTI